jgi:hypothetical protein
MEKKGIFDHQNPKIYAQHAVMEREIMTDMRHPNVVQAS